MEEREEIQDGIARGESIRSMARRLERAPSTVMREINRNGSFRGPGRYRARYRFGARWRGGWDPTPRYRASQAPCAGVAACPPQRAAASVLCQRH
ncbi:helix-turn-helix domain-containing protein [Mycobacterium sp. IEC1808]|uniref:helix-turn-helix domain-containing protein n=1 Tax=Mycobacterium sp. IEC1808 TaxID=1743230 RepID=UPI001F4ED307|nr:helix-turn-helix domain-containing protein [Mycobacterium sp. IEC1808]